MKPFWICRVVWRPMWCSLYLSIIVWYMVLNYCRGRITETYTEWIFYGPLFKYYSAVIQCDSFNCWTFCNWLCRIFCKIVWVVCCDYWFIGVLLYGVQHLSQRFSLLHTAKDEEGKTKKKIPWRVESKANHVGLLWQQTEFLWRALMNSKSGKLFLFFFFWVCFLSSKYCHLLEKSFVLDRVHLLCICITKL